MNWLHGWALAGQAVVATILVCGAVFLYLAFCVWIGQKLHEADMRQQEEQQLEAARRKRRLETLLAIAEEIDAMPETEQQQLQRRAEMMGFMDENDRMVS